MPRVALTTHLREHLPDGPIEVPGETLRAVLENVFAASPGLRGYILDDQGAVRRHVAIFVDGEPIEDRLTLRDTVPPKGDVFVMQSLSGGSQDQ